MQFMRFFENDMLQHLCSAVVGARNTLSVGYCRVVARGATVSPAWFREMRIFDERCLKCSNAMGTAHVLRV